MFVCFYFPLQKAPFFKKLFLNIMKTKLFFLAFLTSLLSWGQATLPVSRTSNWNTATVTGWTHTGTTDRTSTFACSGSNAETFDTTGG